MTEREDPQSDCSQTSRQESDAARKHLPPVAIYISTVRCKSQSVKGMSWGKLITIRVGTHLYSAASPIPSIECLQRSLS